MHGAEKSVKRDENIIKINKFLLPFEIVPFDAASADHYGKTKATLEKTGMLIGPNDLIIASTVLAQNGTLVTHNINEFGRIEGLRIEDWTY